MRPHLLVALTVVTSGTACGGLPLSEAALAHDAVGAERLRAGDLDAAEAHFRLALEHRPGFAEARANLGIVAAERGRLEEAVGHVEAALEVDPDFALGWSSLGAIRERAGDLDDAEAAYARALSIDPDLATPRRNLGLLLLRRGRYREARAHLLRLVAVDATDWAASAHLASCELRLGRPRAAFDRASEILNVRPGHARALLVRGAARARLGELPEAAQDLRRAARDREVRPGALARLLLVAILSGREEEGARVARLLQRDFHRDPAAVYALEEWARRAE